jgi:GAF domain-containing protein/anti-sigma regulatory factor (Ser/Thr protein kinase)
MDGHLEQVRDQDGTFQRIAEAVTRTMNLPVAVWILDEQRQWLRIRGAVGLRPEYVRDAFLALDEPSVTGEAFKEKKIAVSLDIPSDRRWKYKEEAQTMGWKSVLCVPIAVHGTVIGIISIYALVVRDFSDLEKQLLTDYAMQIGLSIEEDRRRETLSRLLSVGHKIEELITEKPKAILEEVVEGACRVTGADCAVLYPYDSRSQDFYDVESIVAYGLQEPLTLSRKPRKEGGMAAYVKRKGTIVLSDIENEDPEMLESPFIQREGIRAFMGLALQVAGDVLGILYINFRAPHQFSDSEKDTIRLFGHQAAIAIYNSRLYQEAMNRAEALGTLHRLSPTLVSVTDTPDSLKAVLHQIAQSAQDVLDADLIDLYEYSEKSDEYGLPPVQVGERYNPTVPKDVIHEDDVVCVIVKSRQPQYYPQAQEESTLLQPYTVVRKDAPPQRFIVREKLRSTAAIPLIVGTEIVGVLFANYRNPQTFPPPQRELIELFASQAAIAIRNARLFQQTQEQIKHLSALFETSDYIGRTAELKEVLDLILDRAFSLVGEAVGYILLIERRTNTLRIAASKGLALERIEAFHSRPTRPNEGTFKIVLEEGKSLEISNARTDPRVMNVGLEIPEILVNIPLEIDNRVIGILGLDAAIPDDSARQSLDALADMAAVAIERARLLEQSQKLQELSTIVASQLSLDDVLQAILEGALDLVNCSIGEIGLLDKAKSQLEFKYWKGGRAPSLPLSETFTGLAVERKEPTRSGNVTQAERYYPRTEDTVSELAVPLMFGDEVIGGLNAESPLPNAFTQEDEDILLAFASQAAIAIKNAQQVQALQVLGKIGQVLTSGIRLEENEILELIRSQASELMDADNMYIALYDELTDTVRFPLAFVNGECVDPVEEPGWQPRKAGKGRTEEVIRTRRPLFHATGKEAEEWYGLTEHEDYLKGTDLEMTTFASWVGVPMLVGEKVLGMIAAYHPTHDHVYGGDDLDILQAMASQAAVALDNARLYYEVNRRLATLVEIGKDMTAATRLGEDEVLELVHRQASKLMDTDNMYIALYDGVSDTVRFGLAFVDGKRIDLETTSGYQPRQGGRGLTEEIIRARESRLFSTKADGNAWYAGAGRKEYVGIVSSSWLGVPMMVGDRVLGVIAAYHPIREYVYSGEDLEVLQGIASQAARALENARLYEESVADQKLKALGTVAATLQHRMNNTFAIIVPNLTLLKRRIDMSDPDIAEIIDIIERNSRLTSDVINRIQASLQETELQEVDVNAALNEVVNTAKELRKSSPHAFVEVALDLDVSLPSIHAPVGQVTEVFRNLVDNAYCAMPKGGLLTVSSCFAEGEIDIRIQDTGVGIPPWMKQRLFKQPVPSREPGGGAGLGLWLSQLVLQSIGGRAIIERSDASGTTILVRIPLPEAG